MLFLPFSLSPQSARIISPQCPKLADRTTRLYSSSNCDSQPKAQQGQLIHKTRSPATAVARLHVGSEFTVYYLLIRVRQPSAVCWSIHWRCQPDEQLDSRTSKSVFHTVENTFMDLWRMWVPWCFACCV